MSWKREIYLGMFLLTGIGVLAFLSFADLLPGELGTNYKYTYYINETHTCDSHWLRPFIYYYLEVFPEQLVVYPPMIELGFDSPLSKQQEIDLDNLMVNDESICHKPKNIREEFTTGINPDSLTKLFMNNIGERPLYYSDGENVTLYILGKNINSTQNMDIRNAFKDMWIQISK